MAFAGAAIATPARLLSPVPAVPGQECAVPVPETLTPEAPGPSPRDHPSGRDPLQGGQRLSRGTPDRGSPGSRPGGGCPLGEGAHASQCPGAHGLLEPENPGRPGGQALCPSLPGAGLPGGRGWLRSSTCGGRPLLPRAGSGRVSARRAELTRRLRGPVALLASPTALPWQRPRRSLCLQTPEPAHAEATRAFVC